MRPLLLALADGQDYPVPAIRKALAVQFGLTEDDLEERLPSGRTRTYVNRVAWALSHLKGASLIDSPTRGVYSITDRGQEILTETAETDRVDLRVLSAFPEHRQFRSPANEDAATRRALAVDVLERVREQTPDFFEQVVLDVLQAIGYGGSRDDAAERLGRGGDGGVDGVIREDKLGLDLIYVQAKRWANSVGRPDIQQFVGALNGQRASKGVFITTSAFSREAREYAESVNPRIILVDGRQLAELMLDHDVGVTVETTYPIRKIDLDYFGVEEGAPPAGGPESAS